MEQLRRTASFWPGFSNLWNHGAPTALVLAVLFAISTNSAILCTFVWTEFISRDFQVLLWATSGLCFAAAATYSFMRGQGQSFLQANARDLFLKAQREYLCGEWCEAEAALGQIVRSQPGDVEAQLFLATIYRHTNRPDKARDQLRRLSKLIRSSDWSMEIACEWRLLSRQSGRMEQEPNANDSDSPTTLHDTEHRRAA